MKKKKIFIAIMSVVMVFSIILGTVSLLSPKVMAQNIEIENNNGHESVEDVTGDDDAYYIKKTITDNNDGTWDVDIELNNWNIYTSSEVQTYHPVDVVFILDNSFSMSSADHTRQTNAVLAMETSLLQMYKEIWRPQEIANGETIGTRLPRVTAVQLGGINPDPIEDEWMYIGYNSTNTSMNTAKKISQAVTASGANLSSLAENGTVHREMASSTTGHWGTYIDKGLKAAKSVLATANKNRQKVVILISDGQYAAAGDFTDAIIMSDVRDTVAEAYDIKTNSKYDNKLTNSHAVIYSIMIGSSDKDWSNILKDYTLDLKSTTAPWLMLEVSSSHLDNGSGLYSTYTYNKGSANGGVQWQKYGSAPVAMGYWNKNTSNYNSFKDIIKRRTLDNYTALGENNTDAKHFKKKGIICECLNGDYFEFDGNVSIYSKSYKSNFEAIVKSGYIVPQLSTSATQIPGTRYYRTDNTVWTNDKAYNFADDTCSYTKIGTSSAVKEGERLYIHYRVKLKDGAAVGETTTVNMFNQYNEDPNAVLPRLTGMKFSAVYETNAITTGVVQHKLGQYQVTLTASQYDVKYFKADPSEVQGYQTTAMYGDAHQVILPLDATYDNEKECYVGYTSPENYPRAFGGWRYYNAAGTHTDKDPDSDHYGEKYNLYSSPDTVTITGDTEFYGEWYGPYTITYNANGGINAPDEQVCLPPEQVADQGSMTNSGFRFIGWCTSPDGPNDPDDALSYWFSPGDVYDIWEDITLYAQWEPADEYNIRYIANVPNIVIESCGSGYSIEGIPGAQNKQTDIDATLSANVPKLAMYTFSEWNTKADGTGTSYTPGDTYSENASLTLYAIWTPNPVTVKYYPTSIYDSAWGQKIPIMPDEYASEHNEYVANAIYSGSMTEDTIVDFNDEYTLRDCEYQMQRKVVYHIEDDASIDGLDAVTDNTEYIDEDTGLPDNRNNFRKAYNVEVDGVFSNWEDVTYGQPTGNNTWYQGNTMDAKTIYVAAILLNEYKNDIYADSAALDFSAEWNTYTTLPTPQRTGYKFVKWHTSADLSADMTYKAERQLNLTNSVLDLYPEWTPIQYEVEYDINVEPDASSDSYSGSMENSTFIFDSNITLSPNAYTYTGRVFKGWSLDPDDRYGEPQYTDGETVSFTTKNDGTPLEADDIVTLYAVWERIEYTLTFDYRTNGGNKENETITAYADQRIDLNEHDGSDARDNGWKFDCWSTDPDGNGVVRYLVMPAEDATVYAQYYKEFTATYYYADSDGEHIHKQYIIEYAINNDTTIDLAPRVPGMSELLTPPNTQKEGVSTPLAFTGWTNKDDIIFAFWDNLSEEEFMAAAEALGDNWPVLYSNYMDDEYPLYSSEDMTTYSTEGPAVIDMYANYLTQLIVSYDMQGGTALQDGSDEPISQLENLLIDDVHVCCLDDKLADISEYPASVHMTEDGDRMNKVGYEFNGWSDTDNNYYFVPGDEGSRSYTTNKDDTLKAQWRAIQYDIVYDTNGGTPDVETAHKTIEETIPEVETEVTKTGYSFVKWNYYKNEAHTEDAGVSEGDNMPAYNLYALAEWNPVPYTIHYYSGNEEATPKYPDPVTRTVEQTIPAGPIGLEFEGHSFDKWIYYNDAEYTDRFNVVEGTTMMPAHDIYAVGQWDVNTYLIKYDANGAPNGSMDPTEAKYDEFVELRENAYSYSDNTHTFLGWNTKADGTGTYYEDKQTVKNITEDDEITLYAMWVNYRKTSELLDGTFGPGKQVKYTLELTFPFNAYYVTMSDFIPNGLKYISSSFENTITKTENEEETVTGVYTVHRNVTAGTTFTEELICEVLPSFSDGTPFTAGNEISNIAYASYSREEVPEPSVDTDIPSNEVTDTIGYYTVTYIISDGETGTLPEDTNQYVSGDTAVIKDNTLDKDGYTFIGWKDEDGNVYTEQENVTITKNITLHALWGKVEKAGVCDAVRPGATVNYTITVYFADDSVTSAVITDTLPDVLTPKTIPSDFNAEGNTITGTLYKPAGESTATITITATIKDSASSGQSIENKAYAEYNTGYTVESNTDELEIGYVVNYIDGEHEYTDGNYYQNGSDAEIEEPRYDTEFTYFIVWNTEPDGSGDVYEPGETVTMTNDLTLYAMRLYIKKTVVDKQENYIPGETVTYDIEIRTPFNQNVIVRDILPEELTFTRVYQATETPDTPDDPGTGNDDSTNSTVTGNSIVMTLNDLPAGNYHIIIEAKVNEKAPKGGKVINTATAVYDGEFYDSNDAEIDIADWFKVIYDANEADGTAPADDNYYRWGDEVTVLGADALSKASSHFEYWSPTSTKGGDKYHPDDITAFNDEARNADGNVVLYAIFAREYDLPETGAYGLVILACISVAAIGAYLVLRKKASRNAK